MNDPERGVRPSLKPEERAFLDSLRRSHRADCAPEALRQRLLAQRNATRASSPAWQSKAARPVAVVHWLGTRRTRATAVIGLTGIVLAALAWARGEWMQTSADMEEHEPTRLSGGAAANRKDSALMKHSQAALLSCGLAACDAGLPQTTQSEPTATERSLAKSSRAPEDRDQHPAHSTTNALAASCTHPLVDDLEDGDVAVIAVDGRTGSWFSFADRGGTTIRPSEPFQVASEGAGGSLHAARISGQLANEGHVWAGMEFNLDGARAPYDLSAATGVCFQAKGTGRARFSIPDVNTDPAGDVCNWCFDNFGLELELTGEWQEYCLRFDEMRQMPRWGSPRPPSLSPDQAYSMVWSMRTPGQRYDLWVDDVRLTCE